MKTPKSIQVNIRLTPDEADAIDRLIESGDFDNKTEFIRFALKKVLKAYDGQRMGFELSDQTADMSEGGGTEILTSDGAAKSGSGRGTAPSDKAVSNASCETGCRGGGAMPVDDFVRDHVEGFCGSEIFDVIQMHLRRRGVI